MCLLGLVGMSGGHCTPQQGPPFASNKKNLPDTEYGRRPYSFVKGVFGLLLGEVGVLPSFCAFFQPFHVAHPSAFGSLWIRP